MQEKTLISIKSKQLLKQINDDYSVYQLIPGRFNLDSKKTIEEILTSISALRESEIKFENKCFVYEKLNPVYYEVLYKDEKIFFNYVVPEKHEQLLINKIDKVFKRATLKKLDDDYFSAFKDKHYCSFYQKRHFMFSLNCDYREEGLIEGMLSALGSINKEDKVLLQIGILPVNDDWKDDWSKAYKKYRKGEEVEVKRNMFFAIADTIFDYTDKISDVVLESTLNQKVENEKKDDRMNGVGRYSTKGSSFNKITYPGFQVQIKLFCDNSERILYYGKIFDGIFKVLNTQADQELSISKAKINKLNVRKFDFEYNKNIFSSKELSVFMQMPNMRLQMEYKDQLKSIEVIETKIPEELMNGSISIGKTTYKGNEIETYWSKDKNILALPKVIIGPMNAGKSEYTKNFIVNASKNGDSVIVFDYIMNCEMSNKLLAHLDNYIVFDLSEDFKLFALAYPEVQPDENSVWDRLKTANILSRQTEFLINSLSIEPLSPRMSRYLDAACKIVYIYKGAKISDVIEVLTNHEIRRKYIDKALQSCCFGDEDSEIIDMLSLNEYDKNGNLNGTKDIKIDGITDRVNIILKDIYLRVMMKAKIDYTQHFGKWIDEGKVIIIQIPEHTFTNKQIKDTLVTYFMSRIWLSVLRRQKVNRLCHVVFDETSQIPVCASLLSNIITEARKFKVGFYFTIHYLKQFKVLLNSIKSAGVSYMLLAGVEKDNISALEEEIDPYVVEDVLKLKPFHSLNVINYGNQYAKFVSHLPEIIK